MEEKKIVYQIILDCWDMAKRYCFIHLDDFLWQMWLQEIDEKSKKYRDTLPDHLWKLYRGIITNIVNYKQIKDKGEEDVLFRRENETKEGKH